MNDDIHEVVTGDAVSSKQVIEGKGKVCHRSQWVEMDYPQGIGDISDGRIPGNIAEVIKEERISEGKAITQRNRQQEEGRKHGQVQLTAMVCECRGGTIYRLQQ
jgi:hypothetical protein